MIACVAVVGPKSNPLHVQPLLEDLANPLKFDYLIYICLDAIEAILLGQNERRRRAKAAGAAPQDLGKATDRQFLGIVNVTPEYHVYGHIMANFTKILVMVASDAKLAHAKFTDEVAAACAQLEREFKHAVSNPFYTPGAVLQSERFTQEVHRIAQRFGAASVPQSGLAVPSGT